MSVLVLAEISHGILAEDITATAVNAATFLGDVTVLCVGSGLDEASVAVSKIEGVKSVLTADAQLYKHGLAEPTASLIASLSSGHSHIVAPATSYAKNILPRVAALLDVMVISDVIDIVGPDTFQRPIYAGNAYQTVRSKDAIKVLTVRTTAFDAAPKSDVGTETLVSVEPGDDPALSEWIGEALDESDRPELATAKTVVSGGRGVGSEEHFSIVESLAGKLDAAVGASRAAVDAGFAPNDWQVGQTGKVVAPDLYIALGISGAIQHLAGMKDSKVIVAINKDQDAPIFDVADIGLVDDLFTAVPVLIERL